MCAYSRAGAKNEPSSTLWTGVQWPLKMILKLAGNLASQCCFEQGAEFRSRRSPRRVAKGLSAFILVVLFVCGPGLAAGKKPSDATLDDNVRIKLSADSEVNGGALKVDVKDGVVTITGVLETQRQKDKATKIARRVKGVKQ